MKPNDIIEVSEVEAPWINGPWLGRIRELNPNGDGWVEPVNPSTVSFRVAPEPHYGVKNGVQGLYLTRRDIVASKIVQEAPHVVEQAGPNGR